MPSRKCLLLLLIGFVPSTACSLSDSTPSIAPTQGDYGTEVTVSVSKSQTSTSSTVRLETHGAPLDANLGMIKDTATFRFPFPATGPMSLVEDAHSTALQTFHAAQPLGTPAIGGFTDRGILDVVMTTNGDTALAFPGSIAIAKADGVVAVSNFAVGSVKPSTCSLYEIDGHVGGCIFRSKDNNLVDARIENNQIVTTSKAPAVKSSIDFVAAGSDADGAYAWILEDTASSQQGTSATATSSSTPQLTRVHSPDWKVDRDRIAMPTELGTAIANHAQVSASVAPDGSLWVAWSESASDPFDQWGQIGVTHVDAKATSITKREVFEHVDDEIEQLRIRATASGFEYFVCAYDSPNIVDKTNRHYCRSGRRSAASFDSQSVADGVRTALSNDASIRAVCTGAEPKTQDLNVTGAGGEKLLHLHPCDGISLVSMSTSSVVVLANDGIYSLRTK